MIGVGPFITIPLLMSALGGPQAMLGWVVAVLIAIPDGMVWSELGAAMPGSGGSYGSFFLDWGQSFWAQSFFLSGAGIRSAGLLLSQKAYDGRLETSNCRRPNSIFANTEPIVRVVAEAKTEIEARRILESIYATVQSNFDSAAR
jgi:hypothetical protein